MPDVANSIIEIKHDNIFFGGDSPHYGEIGLFVQVNNLITLIGEDNAFKGFSALWRNWYYQMSKIPAIDNYVKTRPNDAGYPGNVLKLYGDDGLFSKNESDNMKENIFTKGAPICPLLSLCVVCHLTPTHIFRIKMSMVRERNVKKI
jgi:hypothetical protein